MERNRRRNENKPQTKGDSTVTKNGKTAILQNSGLYYFFNTGTPWNSVGKHMWNFPWRFCEIPCEMSCGIFMPYGKNMKTPYQILWRLWNSILHGVFIYFPRGHGVGVFYVEFHGIFMESHEVYMEFLCFSTHGMKIPWSISYRITWSLRGKILQL